MQVDGIIRQVSQAGRGQGWGAQLGKGAGCKGAHVSSVPLRGRDRALSQVTESFCPGETNANQLSPPKNPV